MTSLKVNTVLLESLLLPGLDARIIGASFDNVTGHVYFHIEGSDVPKDAETVICQITRSIDAKLVPPS